MARRAHDTAPVIVAGALRGRRLKVLPGQVTRPMRSRLRGSLFDMLAAHLLDARVLDLYAGSGALGIEALSRGAGHCTFVEQDPRVLAVLRGNLEDCGLLPDRACLVPDDASRYEPVPNAGLDLVLADPPFARGDWLPRALDVPGVLAPTALLAVQVPRERALLSRLGAWELARQRPQGISVLCLYARRTGPGPGSSRS